MVLFTGQFDDDHEPDSDEDLVLEALDRWNACRDWQGTEDERTREDIKFANGDARNLWQWPRGVYDRRTAEGRDLPCLTINNTRVHNDLIINAMAKNKFVPRVRPTGKKASYKSAEVYETLFKRTLNISRATSHFRKLSEQQVDGGIGYIILETEFVSEKSFDQDIYLRAATDPTGVYLDPWIREPDGSDANFGFIFEKKSRKEFNRKYPEWKSKVGTAALDSAFGEWLDEKSIMLCKYYRKSTAKDTLIAYKADDGEMVMKFASEIKDEAGAELFKMLRKQIKDGEIEGKTRTVENKSVEWYLIAGNRIVARGEWAGKYIPICRCVGRELVIDNTLDRKGHTRPLINAQHMLNYNASVSVQYAASAVKSQWLAPARATEGQEQWKTGNTDNFAVMLYNDIDDEASDALAQVPPPQRIDPPQISAAHQQGMQDAERQMMMISGQFQAQMGENDTQSAASGKAIGERQQQGDTATYHFPEHQSDMFRFIGMQLIDLYPKIYDTERMLQIQGDGKDERYWIKIDPDQTEAAIELKDVKEDEEAVRLSFNPSVGEYECVSDPGPDYATQRQEAWSAYSMILQQNMQLASVIGDQIFRYGDFPGADKIADRLEKEIKATKPYLFDDDASPQLAALQQQQQKLVALNAELMQKLALKEIALKGKDEKRDIEASHAVTDRMKVMLDFLTKTLLSEKDRAMLEHELLAGAHDATMSMIVDANAAELSQQGNGADNTGAAA